MTNKKQSPYALLTTTVVDLGNTEVAAIASFADAVVKAFYADLRRAAKTDVDYGVPFFYLSYDKVTLGEAGPAAEEHRKASKTKKIGRFLCFPDSLTAQDALRVFTVSAPEMHLQLMAATIYLRQLEEEGPSADAVTCLQEAMDCIKALLANAIFNA